MEIDLKTFLRPTEDAINLVEAGMPTCCEHRFPVLLENRTDGGFGLRHDDMTAEIKYMRINKYDSA
jgi:hypothetical protein